MLAILLTYFTAFTPVWRRKRYLRRVAERLLAHGFEAIESYHRTSASFLPFALSLRQAALSLTNVAEELKKFPIYDLAEHGSNSQARRIMAMTGLTSGLSLFLETMAVQLDDREGTSEDQEMIRDFVASQLKLAQGLASGTPMERPEPPS